MLDKLRAKYEEALTLDGAGCSRGQADNGDLGNSQRAKGGESNESQLHFVFLPKRSRTSKKLQSSKENENKIVNKGEGKNGKIKEEREDKRASRQQSWLGSQHQHFTITLNQTTMLLF